MRVLEPGQKLPYSLRMRHERYSYNYGSGGSMKSLKGRLIIVALVVIALALLIMTRGHRPFIEHFRNTVDDLTAPLIELVSTPVRGMHNLMENKTQLFTAYEDNKKLRDENDTLRRWQAVAQALKVENESLRALTGYKPVENVEYVTAHVIAQSPDAYSGTLMIDAGKTQGLVELMPVIDAYGLVGRILEVGDHTARVQLLSDGTSRVPVISGNSRQHAILTGTGDELLRMAFVGGDPAQIQLGEPVMTTSEGGLIPDSVMVGTVFRRDAGGLLVKPLRPLGAAEYVRIMMAK